MFKSTPTHLIHSNIEKIDSPVPRLRSSRQSRTALVWTWFVDERPNIGGSGTRYLRFEPSQDSLWRYSLRREQLIARPVFATRTSPKTAPL